MREAVVIIIFLYLFELSNLPGNICVTELIFITSSFYPNVVFHSYLEKFTFLLGSPAPLHEANSRLQNLNCQFFFYRYQKAVYFLLSYRYQAYSFISCLQKCILFIVNTKIFVEEILKKL